jgi:hypothetical protein
MAAFTAIATGVGLAISATSAGMSFSQAAKQKKIASKANKATDKLMKEAERKAEVEFMQKLNVPLDAYDRQEERNIQSQQQNIEMLQQGDPRNVLAGLGSVGAGATNSAEQNRIAKGKELFALQQMQVQEQSDINQDLKDMKVGAAADQSMRSRDAQEASAAAMQQGVASVGQVVQGAASLVPLFAKSGADRAASKMADGLDQSLLETSVVNKNADAAKYTQYSTEGGADYDMNKAALYQDINKTPLGRNQVISRLQDGRFTDAQLKAYRKTGVYDQSFYDILNR